MTKLKHGPGEENNPILQYQEWAEPDTTLVSVGFRH